MENFTDIFGEDLANLEDLGNLGGFPGPTGEMDSSQGNPGQPGMDSSGPGQPGGQGMPGGGGGPAGPPGMMTGGHGDPTAAAYSQQQQQQFQHQQQQYSSYRPGGPAGGQHQFAGAGYANGPGRGAPGYPPNPGGYSGPQGMMGGAPNSGSHQQQGYPGYPPSQGSMAAWQQQQSQGMMSNPRMYGQSGYPPGGPGMPGHYPGYDQRSASGMNYRQNYPNYQGGSGQGMPQGYPGQGGMPGYHQSGMKSGYPPSSSQHSGMSGGSPYASTMTSQAGSAGGSQQYPGNTGQFHMTGSSGQYPGAMPGSQGSRGPGGHPGAGTPTGMPPGAAGPGGPGGHPGSSGPGSHPGQMPNQSQPNMPPGSQQSMQSKGMMPGGPGMGPGMSRQMPGQGMSPNSPAMGPGGMPSQMMPGAGPNMPPTSMPANPNMPPGGGRSSGPQPHMSPSSMVMSQQSGSQPQQGSQMPQGNQPGGGSSPMYRSPFPPQPSPSQQQSPHSQASPMPQRSPLPPPSTNSPAAHPHSPVSSPGPPRTPNSVQGRMTPTGGPPTPGQQPSSGPGASSLQQLEQMVMPGTAPKPSEQNQQQARSSPASQGMQQVGSPMGPGPKTPSSPGMRGPGTPLSPQQWPQTRPSPGPGQGGPGSGGQYPGQGPMHGMYPGYQQHPGMPGGMSAAPHRMPHPSMGGYPGPNMGGMPGMDSMKGGPKMPGAGGQMPPGHGSQSASNTIPSNQHQPQHQQHPGHMHHQQQQQAMSNVSPGGPVARNPVSEDMQMPVGGAQGMSKGGLSAGPGRPAGGPPVGMSGMPAGPMGGMDPANYQQPPRQAPAPTSESTSLPHPPPNQQQQLQQQQQQQHQQQQQQQQAPPNQQQIPPHSQPSTTMSMLPSQDPSQMREPLPSSIPQQQQQQKQQQPPPMTQQPTDIERTFTAAPQQTQLNPQQQQQQQLKDHDDQIEHQHQTKLMSPQHSLSTTQSQQPEKTTNQQQTTMENQVSSQSADPESTVATPPEHHQPHQSEASSEPESSTERAVPTSTSGDDGDEGDEDEVGESRQIGGSVGGEGSGGEDDRPDTTVKQSPPSTAPQPTPPPPLPTSDGSAPSTSTVGMPSGGQQSGGHSMDPRMMGSGKGGPQMPPGMAPGGMRGQFPPSPHGYPGPTMSPEGPRPRMAMGPNGPVGPYGPSGYLPPNHPIMMEMQALHKAIQQLYSQPQNKQNMERMSELQGRMRQLQSQAAQQAASWSGSGSSQKPAESSGQQLPKGGFPEVTPGPGGQPGDPAAGDQQQPAFQPPVQSGQSQDPYAENFEDESMAEFRKKNTTKKPRERKPKAEKPGEEGKTPKKRGPSKKKAAEAAAAAATQQVPQFDENGVAVELSSSLDTCQQPQQLPQQPPQENKPESPEKTPKPEKKPKRQYNRKKKPEPGALEDLEKIEMPPETLPPVIPPAARLENGEVASSSEDASTSAGSGAAANAMPASADATTAGASVKEDGSPVKEEDKKKSPQPKLKANTPKRPKPNKTLLAFSKKKRKRTSSEGSDLDMERTPPPTPPPEDDIGVEKRRSGRNTKRKKYVDDVPFNLNEEDLKKLPKDAVIPTSALDDIIGPDESEPGTADTSLAEGDTSLASQSGPNYAFVDPTSEDTMIVQFILACRTATREVDEEDEDEKKEGEEDESTADKKEEQKTEPEGEDKDKSSGEDEAKTSGKKEEAAKKSEKGRMVEVEEYLVKFKNFSYLHCQWLTEAELLKGDKRVVNKIKRFHQKRQSSGNVLDFCEEEPFNPDYVEVDRVLDQSRHTDEDTGVTTQHYLVKWRSLPYEDCTWELEADVDPEKIKDYQRWKDPPTERLAEKPRPKKTEWVEFKESPSYKNNNKLREYQLEGVNWLNFSWYNRRNCLLADEMGLGKTIQSLAWIHSIYTYGIQGPFLVIAPLSTIPNWQREFELWTDMNVIVYHGSQTSRNMIQEYEMYYKDDKGERIPDLFKFHVLITTYECIITDIMDLKDISWRACVIDEAHRLKNQKCKLLEGLRLLEIEARLLLSGTPLQNNINELFSLLSFLEPSQFTNIGEFQRDFGDMQNEEQVNKLQALLKPLMLRRMKEDVEKSLKPKEETIVEVELTNIQKKYYRGILEKNFSFLKSSSYSNVPNLMNTMMELRKCCIHPYLLKGAEESIQADYRLTKKDYNDEDDLYYKALVHASGKMVLLDKLLPKLKANGNRVLIFSQMVKMLDILEDYLIRRKYPFERIDGRIRGNLRQAAIDRFCRPDSDRFVFLLCTKAGGLGINLTAADTCIIYDSDWNPQNDLQAQARCHRIGQKKMVKIYRLVTKNTYEREMLDRAGMKLGLDKAVLQSMNTSQGGKEAQVSNSLSKQDVEMLLKKGAYGALMDDDNAGDKFCEEDIEDILSRRATTITHAEEKGSTFSKATFSTSDSATDISIDDPDFWKKWAKKAEIEEIDETMKLMMVEPRNRKKIDRFGGTEGGMDPSQVSDLDSSSDSDGEKANRDISGRTREQKIKDKLKSMRQSGGKSKRPRRGNWEEDDDYLEEERDVQYGGWNKADLFRLEKGVMAYGWGRWEEIMNHAQMRKGWTNEDVEEALRLSCIYSLIIYKGDENIKTFMWDVIAPGAGNTIHRNHSGLSAPVPRGRKNKKGGRRDDKADCADWATEEKYDPMLFLDKSYRKHLDRFHNKLLLRIRLLYYIRHEVLGDFMDLVNNPNVPASKIPLAVPIPEGFISGWWDSEADKSLLIGVYRYGFERYSMMRLDPGLCFLKKCGPPDNEAVQAELDNLSKTDDNAIEDEDDDSSSATPSGGGSRPPSVKPEEELAQQLAAAASGSGYLPFPEYSALNSRVRKLVSAFQRENKKEEARLAAKKLLQEKREERRERIEQVMREREKQKVELQQRKWSRREESNFLRTILAFGVDRRERKFNWDRFRLLGRLETKYEDTMTEYYLAFSSMCKRVAGLPLTEEEELVSGSVEPVGQDKARKVLERVDFLSRLRDNVAALPDLADRLDRLAEPALDLPDWWIPGKHDADLVIGAARHGISRMEYFVLNDIELCFKDVLKRSLSGEPLLAKDEFAAWQKRRQERKQNGAAANDDSSSADGKKNGKKRHGSGKSDEASNAEDEDEKKENGDGEKDDAEEAANATTTTVGSEKDGGDDDEPMDTTEDSPADNAKEKEKLKLDKARAVERASIHAPQLNLQQIEAAIAKGGVTGYDQEMINDLMAQTYAASVRWPRDKVLTVRLQHIVEAVEAGKWPVPENTVLLDLAVDNGTETPVESAAATPTAAGAAATTPTATTPGNHARDTSTPLSEMSEVSGYEDGNVLTHGGLANRKKRGRRPLDCADEKTKLRGMLQSSTPLSATSIVSSNKASTEDSLSESSGNRGNAGEETGLSGILDLKSGQSSKGSKLESALDKLGLQKRKLSDAPADDKSKKKKRLDDLLSGLHAGKGNSVPDKKDSPVLETVDSMLKKTSESSTDLNKLQEMLGPLGGNPADAKVQKWLADQMGVTPERPTTPGSSGATASASSSKRPASTASSAGGLMEWMSKLSGDEHVSVVNRSTGKRLSGSDGPKLKYLPQWLMEHPLYEVDPKWMEEMRLKDEMKKKGPGRPNLDEASKKVSSQSSVGPSYNSMASLGLDPKNPMSALAALDPKNPNSLAALYGLDPKKLDPMTAAMLGLGDPKNPMKMDPMMMAALTMDPKTLQSLGIDPKKLASMASPAATSKSMEKSKQSSSSAAAAAAAAMSGLDPMMLAACGMDPKKLDPAMAAALGLDPKNPKFDPMVLASLGLDPKNPNSTLLAAMAAMDPNNQLAAMYGLMPPGFPMPGGMDLLGKGKHSPQPKDTKSPLPAPSPRSSSSQREGPSPRPPSRASQSSRDGRSTPRSSHPASSSYSQASPRTSVSNTMFGSMNPFGLDPKLLQASGIDPKLLASMDPKLLAGLDPKMMAMLDPRMASLAGMDLKALMQMDPKLLQSAGIDPKMLQQLLDPKSMMGMDPKMFGMDPKSSAAAAAGGLDPKLLQSMGIDPKMLAGLDPKMLQSMGIDPKLLGLDPKGGFDPKTMGLDPKMLAAMDPKLLSDPKFLASLDPKMMFGGLDPKLLGIDPKMFGLSSAGSSAAASLGSSRSTTTFGSTSNSTIPTSATGTTMSIPSSSSFSSLTDPRLLGLDPKMLQGLDEKALKSLGLDPNIVKSLLGSEKSRSSSGSSRGQSSSSSSKPASSTSTTFAGLDPKMFPGMDPKMLSMMDPKMLAAAMSDPKMLAAMSDPKMLATMSDPKMLAAMSDPKMLAAMSDPKMLAAMYGMDMKALASLDPKMLASFGIDPKWLDPKAMAGGVDPKASGSSSSAASSAGTSLPPSGTGGIDAKLLASMGIDAKTLAAMDPKVLASYGIDMKTIQALEAQSKQPTPSTSGSAATASASNSSQDASKSIAGLDPKLLAAAGIDPKLLAGMDAKTLASLGLDAKSLSAALDPKNLPKSTPSSSAGGIDLKMLGLDPKTLQSMGIDPKMLSDPKFLASMGLDPKMLASMGLDPKALSAMGGMDPKSMSAMAGMDPKMLASLAMDPKALAAMGLDPKMLASMGLDPKTMASLGLDPKSLSAMGMDPKSLSSLTAGMDPKLLASMGMDPKALASLGMDPKALASLGMDPKALASLGMDPKALAAMGMDPKALAAMGMDPKTLASLGMDPKALAAMGMDPKALAAMGMDPKALSAMGMDPKSLAAMGLDPKALDPKMLGFDPKALANLDPKMLASMGLDPKLASDPNLLAMYAMGMPGMMPPMSMSNGFGSSTSSNSLSGTPIPGTSKGSSGAPAKPKPGTVAAALQEKKESEKTRATTSADITVDAEGAPEKETGGVHVDAADVEEEVRRGLTSEERVLLREKKKERLMKEVESEAGGAGGSADESAGGLNLSVPRHPADLPVGGSSSGGGSTKLEALLNKPIDEPAAPPSSSLSADDRPAALNNGDAAPPPQTDGNTV